MARTDEATDAVYRAKAEVTLLLGKYVRRMRARATEICDQMMAADPDANPDKVGYLAFKQAAEEQDVIAPGDDPLALTETAQA